MSDVLESECYKKGWDALTVDECKVCNGQIACKDGFINGEFWDYMNNPANASKTVEVISEELKVSVPSITECISAVEAIKGLTKRESEEPKKEIEVKEVVEKETVQEEKKEVVETPVVSKQGPVKARRGRKPADLITCPVCGGTGGTVDNLCEVCGGYGDISEKKWKVIEKKNSKDENNTENNIKPLADALCEETKGLKEEIESINAKQLKPFIDELNIPKTEKIDNPKTSVVEVVNNNTGETIATWGKFPFTVHDLKELRSKGAEVSVYMGNTVTSPVEVTIKYNIPISKFYKE